VVLEGDRDIVLGEVVFILDEAKRAGATEVAIAARRP
jgi:biopolymer transport protein ExbD